MQEIYRVLARLMQTDLTVMITGESGTGKELVARALHDYGKRRNGPFVAINMAAIPRDLIESELFGHEKGAFTGANTRSAGRFEQAEGGTLFLDEIGDMPMEAQTRLLRVLQQGEYTTVGGRTPIKTDVRIIAATNKDLRILDPAGPVPRGPVLPPERRAAAAAAAARARRGHPRPVRHFFAQAEREGLPAKQLDAGGARAAQALPLARQRARAGEPRAPARRALPAGDDHRARSSRPSSTQPRASPTAGDEPRAEESLSARGRAAPARYFASFGDDLPPPGLYHRILREIEYPLLVGGAGRDPRQPDPGRRPARRQPQHAAQEDPRPRHPGDPHQRLTVRRAATAASAGCAANCRNSATLLYKCIAVAASGASVAPAAVFASRVAQ